MKQYVDELYVKGYKVKIYYMVCELMNYVLELFVLKSFGYEIFLLGKGGGYVWLQEYLDGDYIGVWFVDVYKDVVIVNIGILCWYNFYVEGLNWLIKNVGIDGVYIDDLVFDCNMMKCICWVLESNCFDLCIDVYLVNQFNLVDGYINSIFFYMEYMFYLDCFWFGEYFKYEKLLEYWLIDVLGIFFGMMSEMLQDGGNFYWGMLYGMIVCELMEFVFL